MSVAPDPAGTLDDPVAELAERYTPLAVELLREAIRIPADHVDRPADDGGDPSCGLSNHEGPRLSYLRDAIVRNGAVRHPGDVGFDEVGNLVWTVQDDADGIPPARKRVVYFDGHSDTVNALRSQWRASFGASVDAYEGAADPSAVDRDVLASLIGYVPPADEMEHLVFGRGAADQLAGVVAQVVATKILVELAPQGALRGVIVRSYATVSEEDNDGQGPRHVRSRVLPGAGPELVPDAVILTEGTGDAVKGALGIYRGQRGRMQIEVTVTGRSCHGSMPFEGLNPLEHAAAILVEAAARHVAGDGFAVDDFLGRGTRTASWATLDTPSDCAVPERFTFRFDRRLTLGETAEAALADVEGLASVAAARAAGLQVDVSVPTYRARTWVGHEIENPQVYPGWVTPEDHVVVQAAVAAYRRVVSPHVAEPPGGALGGALRREPRVDRWIFSTDGVGFVMQSGECPADVAAAKRWVHEGHLVHPPMVGIGAGIEQNTHRIGECVDQRELRHAIAMLARFPRLLVEMTPLATVGRAY